MAWPARKLGGSGLSVAPIGLGCVGMSGWYGGVESADSERTLAQAIDLGVDFFDTADAYGLGANEELLGRVLAPHRSKIRISTKFGNLISPDGKPLGAKGTPDYVRQACEASLRRLGVESIDLYFLHRIDPAVPVEETIGAMADLVRQGKVRAIGLSEASPASIRRAHAVHPVSAVESEYSLWWREPETAVIPLCQSLGIAFVAFSPLGRGFFTGRFRSGSALANDDRRNRFPRFSQANLERNSKLLGSLESLAVSRGISLPQLCLAWTKVEQAIPIPGSSKPAHLVDNFGAVEIHLSPQEVEEIEHAFDHRAVAGERYAADSLRQVGL